MTTINSIDPSILETSRSEVQIIDTDGRIVHDPDSKIFYDLNEEIDAVAYQHEEEIATQAAEFCWRFNQKVHGRNDRVRFQAEGSAVNMLMCGVWLPYREGQQTTWNLEEVLNYGRAVVDLLTHGKGEVVLR